MQSLRQATTEPLMRQLLVASTNVGKLREFRTLDLPITWLSLADLGLEHLDVEETGDTFEANALLKARAHHSAAKGVPTLADDSGLVVDALNGAPGVYSARYAAPAERNAKLLAALDGIPLEQRTARFVCVIALVLPDEIAITAEGRVEGHIGFAPRGDQGFGYDPVFLVDANRTMAELSPDDKNVISHRGRAIAKLKPLLACLVR